MLEFIYNILKEYKYIILLVIGFIIAYMYFYNVPLSKNLLTSYKKNDDSLIEEDQVLERGEYNEEIME